MQSDYGGRISEIQQFMMDGSLFLPPPPPPPPPPPSPPPLHNTNINAASAKIQHHHQMFYHLQPPHHQPAAPQMTQHEFSNLIHPTPITQQLFHHPHHHFQLFHNHGLDLQESVSFKLGVNGSGGGNGNDDDDNGMIHGDNGGDDTNLHSWHREEESAAKEPFWRRPLDIDYINRKRQLKDKSSADDINNKINKSTADYNSKKSKQADLIVEQNQENERNPIAAERLYSELEAIYKPGSAGSGSALTADENPILPAIDIDRRSDISDTPSPLKNGGRRKHKEQAQMSSIAAFFDSLAKQVIDRQESLHQKFLEIMERRDQERASRDEAWRNQEAERSLREANARARERCLAANRDATIVSFLEKITGERIDLPEESRKLVQDCNALELYKTGNTNGGQLNTSRWPKAEVQALIRVRSGLESRFQEPGLKGPLWEEVSAKMATVGYSRNAKRCKEKWENINKYFRKTKDSGKKRPEHSKTCPYFYQLDQFYSKCNRISGGGDERKDINSELLDAIVVSNVDHQSFKFGEMNMNEEQDNENGPNDGDINEEERDGEEGEGDSQDQQGYDEEERIERDQHDTSLFSHRLRS